MSNLASLCEIASNCMEGLGLGLGSGGASLCEIASNCTEGKDLRLHMRTRVCQVSKVKCSICVALNACTTGSVTGLISALACPRK